MRNHLLIGAAVAALVIPVAASAQETTTTIRGTVSADGAPVSGATIVATHLPSGTRSTATTGSNGTFTLVGLRDGGPFTVEVSSASGSTTVTDIFTVVGQPFDLPVALSDSTDDSEIVVTAASIVGAGVTSDGPQTVLTQRDVQRVASVNRDIRDLARRDPLATLDLSNSRAVSFAGVNPRFNRFTINGVQVGDNFGLNSDANPTGRGPIPFDAIGQFSVSIAPYDIRQGNFQGGVIDTVLLSGTNRFAGTGFYSQSRDEFQGSRIGSNVFNVPDYNSETYGATLSGPIIRDKLFFMVSAERNTDPRPLTPGSIDQVPNLTSAQVDTITGIAQSVYGYDPGGLVQINNQKDEKIVGKIDWNISDTQRLSLSYINAYESSTVLQNSSTSNTSPSLGLESNAYQRSVLLRAGIVQLNSDWADNLSSEVRFIYKSNEVSQEPLRGRGFAQFLVCTAPTSVINTANGDRTDSCGTGNPTVALGPDISRQANDLFFDTWGGSFLLRYNPGNHDVKAFAEVMADRYFNLFLQRTSGAYYFDSIQDFQNRNASTFDYANAVSLNINDAAADFKYQQYTFGLQDDWTVTDTLTVSLGARYDLFAMSDAPAQNDFFLARTGFRNTKTYKGIGNFQPRASFNFTGIDRLKIRGGVGVFGGGSPAIYLSNSFSNTGISQNRISTVRRTNANPAAPECSAPYNVGSANAALCSALLTGVTGSSVPAVADQFVSTNTGSLATAPVNALDQNFRLPSVTKATLSADYNLFGFNIGADYIYSDVNQAVNFIDARVVQIGTLPDGRPRYAPVTNLANPNADTNSDIIITNTQRGRSHIGVVRFDRTFDNGFFLGGSYALQDVKDVSPATSSTAGSLYANAAMADPNTPAYGVSNDQTRWAFKYNIGFDKALFGDYRTIVSLFGETRAGRHYSFTMENAGSTRSPVFGTIGNNNRYLLYVPTANDPIVSYDSEATRQSLETLINNTELQKYRGQIAPKNIARARAFTRIDLHVEQEIPTGIGNSRIALFGDIENLPNLLNSDWGGLRQLGFPYTAATVQVQCLSQAVPTGTAPGTGVTNTSPTQNCAQYRYSAYRDPNEAVPQVANSLYLIRIGARVRF